MPEESNSDLQLEIGHVLFIDIVGYSKLLINEQTEALKTLNEVVRTTPRFRNAEAAGELIRLPTGDGMALVFLDELEAPVECALEISRGLLTAPQFGIRMGIHSGPVNQVADVNGRLNLTGAGINIACRVMDCGDAGHILLSNRVAEDLGQYRHWKSHLHPLGFLTVKHDLQLGLTNLYTDELGNRNRPQKITAASAARRAIGSKRRLFAIAAVLAALVIGAALFLSARAGDGWSRESRSIGVLPFENRSDEAANAYFARGVQDEILTRLWKIGGLKAISRISMQQYEAEPKDLVVVAKELGVATILQGSVQKAGDVVFIHVSLMNPRARSPIWTESYERKLTDIFAVEKEVAKRIAGALRVTLTGSEEKALDHRFTDNPRAYDAYLRGLNYEGHGGFSEASLEAKVLAYQSAVELDPEFAQAWAGLCAAQVWTYFGSDHTAQRLELAKHALDNALRWGPDSGEVFFALGEFNYAGTQDYDAALKAYAQARERLPGSAEVLMRMGSVTRRLGRWEEALTLHTQAAARDPRNALAWQHQGLTLRGLRKYAEAITAFDHALEVAPGDPDLIGEKATTYQMQGDLSAAAALLEALPPEAKPRLTPRRFNQWLYERKYETAINALKTALEKREGFRKSEIAEALSNLALLEVLAGQREAGIAHATEAKALLDAMRQQGDDNPWHVITFAAQTYSLLGEDEAARRELERASTAYARDAMIFPQVLTVMARTQCESGDSENAIKTLERVLQLNCAYAATPALLRFEPFWDPLRQDPRFQALSRD